MKTTLCFVAIFIAACSSSFAQENSSRFNWLMNLGLDTAWLRNSDYKINNKKATYEDAIQIPDDKIGKIEIVSQKEDKGTIRIDTISLPGHENIVTINDTLKYFVQSNDTLFIRNPEAVFEGGSQGWTMFRMQNLRIDAVTQNGGRRGVYKPIVNFILNENGTLGKIKIAYDPGYGAGDDARRFIEESKSLWKPTFYNGKAVKSFISVTSIMQIAK